MAGIGHNSGQFDEPGKAWRTFSWKKARRNLVPTLPIEVVRLRVRRAAELGLPYKTYAGIRASTGHDLIGFLFSNHALRVLRDGQELPKDRADKLVSLARAESIGITHAPVSPQHLASLPGIKSAYEAPAFNASWAEMRDRIRTIACADGKPADRYLIVGDTSFEREWAEAARTAGYLPAAQFFWGALDEPPDVISSAALSCFPKRQR